MELPALYESVDRLSNKSQNCFKRLILASLLSACAAPLAASIASFFGEGHKVFWFVAIIATLCSSVCSVVVLILRPEQDWYSARAIAESLKTASWKYAMRADPFEVDDVEAQSKFSAITTQLLTYASRLGLTLEPPKGEQVTEDMRGCREMPWDDRLTVYLRERVNEQKGWYAGKANDAASASKQWLIAIIVLYSGALVIGLVALSGNTEYLVGLLGLCTTAASSSVAWLQVKRDQELAKSYGLTAHELNLVLADSDRAITEETLASYVTDAENAVSREHSTWLSRREA